MIRDITALCGCKVVAADGTLGRVAELLFDDKNWRLRYVVVDLSDWQPGGKIMLPAVVLGGFQWDRRIMQVNLTRDDVMNHWVGAATR